MAKSDHTHLGNWSTLHAPGHLSLLRKVLGGEARVAVLSRLKQLHVL